MFIIMKTNDGLKNDTRIENMVPLAQVCQTKPSIRTVLMILGHLKVPMPQLIINKRLNQGFI